MSEPLVLVDASDPQISVVALNRPDKRNALSIELIEQLCDAVTSASSDRNRRVILIRANGPVFCAGLDLKEATDPAKAHSSAVGLCDMYRAIATSPLITIASAQGGAFGGGAGLVAACDIVVGAPDLRIGYPEVHRGLVAALVTTLLRRQLGERVVRELVLLGQTVDATRALQLGLINRIGSFDDALSLAREACTGAPGAIARSKRLLDSLSARTIEEDLERALDFHVNARQSQEAAEGMKAFLEKRPPNWGPRDEDA
jgi:methylglutaconyl-CoA hydratase